MKYSIHSEDLINADNSYEFDLALYQSDVYEHNTKYEYFIEIKNNRIYVQSENYKDSNPYSIGSIIYYPEIMRKINKINIEIRNRKLKKI